MTSIHVLYVSGLYFHEEVAFMTSHGKLLWSTIQYHYLVLISDQNDVERCVIPVAYLLTSQYGQKWLWSAIKWSGVVLPSWFLHFLINGRFWSFWDQNQVSSSMHLCRRPCIWFSAKKQYFSTFQYLFSTFFNFLAGFPLNRVCWFVWAQKKYTLIFWHFLL